MFLTNFKGPDEPNEKQFEALLRRGIFRLFVLKKDDLPDGKKCAGMAVISNYGRKSVIHIDYLAISELCQGKGLGVLLMKSLIGYLTHHGSSPNPKLFSLECEERLIPFYSRLGFLNAELKPMSCQTERDGKVVTLHHHLLVSPVDSENQKPFSRSSLRTYRKQLDSRIRSHLDQEMTQ